MYDYDSSEPDVELRPAASGLMALAAVAWLSLPLPVAMPLL